MEEYININENNFENEHLCCAIADKKHQEGVSLKKQWLKEDLKNGHVFRKLNVNGKVFIEYVPLDYAWVPVVGNNFMYIYCLWVAGSYKGKGYGHSLLEYAINEAKEKGMNGICTLSSTKKKPFLSEKPFLIKHGFKVVDTIGDYELLSLNFNNDNPKFNDNAKKMEIDEKDLTIYYTPQCPYITNCINEIKEYSHNNQIKINFIKINNVEEAKKVPCVFNNWATFINHKYVSNVLLNANSLDKLIKENK